MNSIAITVAIMILNSALTHTGAVEIRNAERQDYVVLLHGLGRTPLSLKRLEWVLKRENYRVVNPAYPSTRISIEAAADEWLDSFLKRATPDAGVKIHFVTHSLGGIILRQYLSQGTMTNLGRVVMLAPPNQGSELVDKFKNNRIYKYLTGESGQELGTDALSIPKRLGRANFEVGIIAGDRSLNPLFSAWIPGPDDGKVSVRRAELEGMRDFMVVHSSHTWLAWRREVAKAVSEFLRTGRFLAITPAIKRASCQPG